ncbi:DMT family transporter [Pseudonocardia spinosispora]|uniref:DMT family transporter n=1 Tax=Pseudonocardia spinosispora TaxID=103441 RepID=UPI000417F3A4|nr:DMT family transporter [Pseudonocardia spinosispora]
MLLALGFVLCWSSGFIGAKLGVGQASALTLLMWRFVPLALVLVAVAAVVYRARWREWSPRMLGREVGIGLLSQSGYLLTVYAAIQLGVSSGTTALIDGTQPLVAGALSGPLLRQYVSRRQWIGLVLGLTGVIVVTSADASANPAVALWAYGVPFLGMLCLVAATFLERRTEAGAPPLLALSVHCLSSAVVFTVLAASAGVAVPPSTGTFWLSVGWLVLLSTFGGYGLYWLLLRRSGVTRVNALMFLMAPVTTVWGALMFGEPLGWRTVLGLVLGLIAVLVVHRVRPASAENSDDPIAVGR